MNKKVSFKVMLGVIPGYGHENKDLTAENAYYVGKEEWEKAVKEVSENSDNYEIIGDIVPALAVYSKNFGCPEGGEVGIQIESEMEEGQDKEQFKKSVVETVKNVMQKLGQSTATVEWSENGESNGTTYIYDGGKNVTDNESIDGIAHLSYSFESGTSNEEYVRVGSAIQRAMEFVSSMDLPPEEYPEGKYYMISGVMTPSKDGKGIEFNASQNPNYGQTESEIYWESGDEMISKIRQYLGYYGKTYTENGVRFKPEDEWTSEVRYVAKKEFNTFKEAVDEILLSWSLAESDLPRFLGEDVKDLQTMKECVTREKKRDLEQCTDEDGNLDYYALYYYTYPQMMSNAFEYTTCSGINSIYLEEIRDKETGEIKGYSCEYAVKSEKPLEYSTAMRTFKDAGWDCQAPGHSIDEQEERIKEFEEEMIESIRDYRYIPGISCYEGDEYSKRRVETGAAFPFYIQTLLKNHPELADEIVEIIDEQIAKIDDYEESDFWYAKKGEIIQTLNEIKSELIKEKQSGISFEGISNAVESHKKDISDDDHNL